MKKKLLSVAVASALGFGTAGYANAQGVKAYVTGKVENIRLVNPNTNTPEGRIINGGLGAFGNGTTDASASVLGVITEATTGRWNSTPGFPPPPPNLPDDAAQSCIDGDGNDFIPDFPGASSPPCPQVDGVLGNDFSQVQPLFQDFGRGDMELVSGVPLVPGGQPDVDIDGDDFEFVAACQRSGNRVPKTANGNTTSLQGAQEFYLSSESGHFDTEILEWRGTYSGMAEAITSNVGVFSSAAASGPPGFRITRVSDGATVDCDVTPITTSALALGPNDAPPPDVIPPDTDDGTASDITVVCDANDFEDAANNPAPPFIFEASPDSDPIQYRSIVDSSGDTTCTLDRVDEVPPGFKAYFTKQRADDIITGGRIPVVNVQVNDQFQSRFYDAFFLHELWNAALKDEVPEPNDPRLQNHKTCYKIRPTDGVPFIPSRVDIETTNFGLDSFRLGQPWELCLPSVKTVLPDGEPEGSLDGTHYLCYTASSVPVNQAHTLYDQFGTEEVIVTGLEQFCVPAGKNEPAPDVVEDPEDPGTWQHLACYSIFEQSGPELPIPVRVVDQFAPNGATARVEEPRQWCEPAYKAAVDGVPTNP